MGSPLKGEPGTGVLPADINKHPRILSGSPLSELSTLVSPPPYIISIRTTLGISQG